MEINTSDTNFKELLINTPKGIKDITIKGDIDIKELCDILENTKPSIKINYDKLELVELEFKERRTYQGFNRSILNMVKKICEENVTINDYTVDATIGNGNDTMHLATISKFVFGFDIQEQAITNTTNLLKDKRITNYKLFKTSHDKMDSVLKDYKHKIKLILFNLGYLPCGDKSIMTNHKTTLKALEKGMDLLTKDGLILIVFYPHPEGRIEATKVLEYLISNDIKYQVYKNTTNKDAPYLVVIKYKNLKENDINWLN